MEEPPQKIARGRLRTSIQPTQPMNYGDAGHLNATAQPTTLGKGGRIIRGGGSSKGGGRGVRRCGTSNREGRGSGTTTRGRGTTTRGEEEARL